MIEVILAGHGNVATGLESAVKLVFGSTEKFSTIDFEEGMSAEVFEEKLENLIDDFEDCEGTLILTDIAGGTPFKTAVVLSLKKEKVKVISGVNVPMILEVISERDDFDIESLFKHTIETAKSQIIGYEKIEKLKNTNDNFEDEGI